jgi:NAD(P)-dependent dehydrogenase (short-subunit alcohol dehydrogenase family)
MTWTVRDKTVLLTGGTSGIGEAAAAGLARAGADLVLVARDRARAEATAARLEREAGRRPDVLFGDLAVQADVRRVAAEFLTSGRPLHVLVNNAGLVMGERVLTPDGIETSLAVNHLAGFLLTNLLLGRLRESAPARVVNVSSVGHRFVRRFDFADLDGGRRFRGLRVYCQTKLANVLFTRELARRLEGMGITVNCMHPGNVATRFGQNNHGILDWGSRLITRLRRTPAQGADTIVHLCVAPELAMVTGEYFYERRPRPPSRGARRPDDARRLWEVSATLTGMVAQSR